MACRNHRGDEMMRNRKKLRLDVDELKVEAFATVGSAARKGTVHGYCEFLSCITTPCGSNCECPIPSDSGTIPCWCLPPIGSDEC